MSGLPSLDDRRALISASVRHLGGFADTDWVSQRQRTVSGAIRYLKSRGILVTPVDRDAQIRRYWVTGKMGQKLAEDVVEIAESYGFEVVA